MKKIFPSFLILFLLFSFQIACSEDTAMDDEVVIDSGDENSQESDDNQSSSDEDTNDDNSSSITLTANPDIISNNGEGEQVWGEGVTLTAFKIDGSGAQLVYDTEFKDKGFGVAGARWKQIDYYQDYQGEAVNASEKITIDFNNPVKNIVLTVGMMGANEGHPQGETGKWTGFDESGAIIADGLIGADDSALGNGVKVNDDSYGTYPFKLSSEIPLYSITIEATGFGYGDGNPNYRNYDNESGNQENNSDFNIVGISFERL